MSNHKEKILPAPFTGERFIPGATEPLLALEHYHRYYVAGQFVSGKKVLDIACGTGYGSAYLAKNAASVLGVDKDPDVISGAQTNYAEIPNLAFQVGECENFPGERNAYDTIISLETLEHLSLTDQEQFLAHVNEMLTSEGICIISTPEREEYARGRERPNEFHKHEHSAIEFSQLLLKHFRFVKLYAQKSQTLSLLWNMTAWKHDLFKGIFQNKLTEQVPEPHLFEKPLYLFAICTNSELIVQSIEVENSFFLDGAITEAIRTIQDRLVKLQAEYVKRTEWALQLDRLVNERTLWAQNLESLLKERDQLIAALQQMLEERTAWAHALNQMVTQSDITIISLQEQYSERTQWAVNLERLQNEKDELITSLQRQFDERTRWAQELDRLVKERDETIRSYQQQLEERSTWAKQLDQLVHERDEFIRSLQRQNDERAAWAQELDGLVRERDELIRSLQQQIEERTTWAQKLDVLVGERDEAISSFQQQIVERTTWAKQLDQLVRERDTIVLSLQKELSEITAWSHKLQEESDSIKKLYSSLHKSHEELQRGFQEQALLNQSLESRIHGITDSPIYRALAFLGLLRKY